jgi:hypothetical protein
MATGFLHIAAAQLKFCRTIADKVGGPGPWPITVTRCSSTLASMEESVSSKHGINAQAHINVDKEETFCLNVRRKPPSNRCYSFVFVGSKPPSRSQSAQRAVHRE